MTERQSLTILDRPVPRGTHMCVFFSGPAERDQIVLPFLAEGIRAGQKCICMLGPGS
jgi:MEDS: MEthanogen/methylotroph, DcmR Sensory domain